MSANDIDIIEERKKEKRRRRIKRVVQNESLHDWRDLGRGYLVVSEIF